MPTITKKKTKMIVKDGNGGLLQLLPETEVDAELDEESSNPVASSAVAEALSGIEDAASNMGAIKVMDEEPTALNTTEYAGETLIAWVQHESWSITINTEAETEGDRMGQIPFCLYGVEDASMKIDWGDGTTSTYTSANAVENSCPTHEYASAGEYTIKMESDDFNRLHLWTSLYGEEGDPTLYRATLKSIDKPLPQIAGVHGLWYNEDTEEEVPGDIDNSFYSCFSECTSLQSIPSGLFDSNTAVTDFSGCFYNCQSLQFIPSGLFDSNTAVTSFISCFYYCTSLQSIPSGLFDSNTAVTSFGWCFTNCSSLQSIPSGLFDKNTAVTDFSACFQNCTFLQSIPSGLFDKNTAVTTFQSCFQSCSSLQSIPSGLFDSNTAVISFGGCFSGCSSLASIPSGLFDRNTAVTSFQSCFNGCSSLQSIPSGLFDRNTAVTSFSNCFRNCTSIQSIPSGLFDNNTAVTSFGSCFYGCSSLTDFTLYIGSSLVSSCSSFVTNKSGTTRTIYVPSGSTTQTKFNAVASSLGITVIGE